MIDLVTEFYSVPQSILASALTVAEPDWQLSAVDLANFDRVQTWIIDLVKKHNRVCISWERFRHEILAEHRRDLTVHRTLEEMRMDWPCDFRKIAGVTGRTEAIATHLLRKGIVFTRMNSEGTPFSDRQFIGMMVGLTGQPDGVTKLRKMLKKRKGPTAKFIGGVD